MFNAVHLEVFLHMCCELNSRVMTLSCIIKSFYPFKAEITFFYIHAEQKSAFEFIKIYFLIILKYFVVSA